MRLSPPPARKECCTIPIHRFRRNGVRYRTIILFLFHASASRRRVILKIEYSVVFDSNSQELWTCLLFVSPHFVNSFVCLFCFISLLLSFVFVLFLLLWLFKNYYWIFKQALKYGYFRYWMRDQSHESVVGRTPYTPSGHCSECGEQTDTWTWLVSGRAYIPVQTKTFVSATII